MQTSRVAALAMLAPIFAACGGSAAPTSDGTKVLDCATCHTAANLSAAHAVHIVGSSSSAPFPCSECHTLYTSMSHTSGAAVVTFATEAGDIGKTGGLSPTWNATATTCSNVYCHGGDGTVITNGNVTSPNWTKVDGSQDACDSCHGDPPTSASHIQCTKDFCNVCHSDVHQGGSISSTTLHVNGVVDVMTESTWGTLEHGLATAPPGHPDAVDFSSCEVCHGSPPVGNSPVEVMTCTTCHD